MILTTCRWASVEQISRFRDVSGHRIGIGGRNFADGLEGPGSSLKRAARPYLTDRLIRKLNGLAVREIADATRRASTPPENGSNLQENFLPVEEIEKQPARHHDADSPEKRLDGAHFVDESVDENGGNRPEIEQV